MNQNVKLGIAGGLFGVALLVGAISLGFGRKAVGSGVDASATCPKCGEVASYKMSYVFNNGVLDTGKGWMMQCPKCQTPAPVRREGVAEGKPAPGQ